MVPKTSSDPGIRRAFPAPAEAEIAARQTLAASAQSAMDKTTDTMLNDFDKNKSKGIYLPPNAILGKKQGN